MWLARPASVTEVGLDLEAKTAEAATRLGFQSLHAIADVDCSKGANRFINAEAYDQPSLAGPGRPRNVTGQWVQPSSDSYMAVVIGRVCAAPATVVAAARTRVRCPWSGRWRPQRRRLLQPRELRPQRPPPRPRPRRHQPPRRHRRHRS